MRDQYGEFQKRGAEVLAVAPHAEAQATDYLRRNQIPFPCLADQEREVYRLYGVWSRPLSLGQRPALFVIDKEGVARYAYLGWQQWEIPNLSQVLAELDRLNRQP